jgi:putative flippase GtrA
LVDYLTTVLLTTRFSVHYLLSSTIGYSIGIVINYIFSITWVFSKRNLKNYWHVELGIFISIEVIALLLMNMIMFFAHDYLFISFYIAKLIGNFAAFIWNYLIKHLFLFKSNPDEAKHFKEDTKKLYDK